MDAPMILFVAFLLGAVVGIGSILVWGAMQQKKDDSEFREVAADLKRRIEGARSPQDLAASSGPLKRLIRASAAPSECAEMLQIASLLHNQAHHLTDDIESDERWN